MFKLLFICSSLVVSFFPVMAQSVADTAEATADQIVDAGQEIGTDATTEAAAEITADTSEKVAEVVNSSEEKATNANEASSDAAESSPTGPILSVTINGLDDEELLSNAKAFLDLDKENGKVVENTSYAQFLARAGVEQIQQSLQPFGYYLSTVEMSLNESATAWDLSYQVELGEPVIISSTEVSIEGTGKTQKEFVELVTDYPLSTGDILLQSDYTAFKDDVLALAVTDGYFDGDFTDKRIVLSDDYQKADIIVAYNTGQRYVFAQTTFEQDFLDDDVFQRFVIYEAGDNYSSKSLADVQRDLYNSNYVDVIDVTADPVTEDKNVPVNFAITPKKNKKHTFAFGYGTDTGIRAKYDFDWRWVNRRGHQFNANVYASQIIQSAGIEYRIPAARPATDYYRFFANVENEDDEVDSFLWNVGAAYHDQRGNWEREIGIQWQQEDFTLGNDSGNVGLLTPFASLTYRKVDNPLTVDRGLLLSGFITGAHESALSDVSFLQAVASAKAAHRFDDVNKLTLSGAVGRTWVSDFHRLPADYRFFTGGDRTIRGYSYESIGDRDSSDTNIGGDKMYFVSAEYEYFFREDMAAAVFVDAGDAFSDDSASLKVGAGVGFHYYSPIGPIRVDIAHGFDSEVGDDVRLHLNIGPGL